MSTPALVADFYRHIWHAGNRSAAGELLAEDFLFRGSLAVETRGLDRFWDYVREVRSALADFHCDILECVCEAQSAFAKMQFSGLHVGEFRGYRPTGLPLRWLGAALFHFEAGRIRRLWVLGDLAALDAMLGSQAGATHTRTG
jgi:predicted ester cyclase